MKAKLFFPGLSECQDFVLTNYSSQKLSYNKNALSKNHILLYPRITSKQNTAVLSKTNLPQTSLQCSLMFRPKCSDLHELKQTSNYTFMCLHTTVMELSEI